jgi:hypothetical protein
MTKKLLLFICFCTFQFISAQEIYLYTGKNFTSYHYKNAIGESSTILDKKNKSHFEEGHYYEIGYVHHFKNTKITYIGGLTLNEFNTKYFISNTSSLYTWKTKYLGIQNLAAYPFFKTKNGFDASIKGGFIVSALLNAEQSANGIYYDISKNEDFSGIIIQSTIGISIQYKISERASLNLGYNLSTVINASENTMADTRFTNHQIQFGINVPLNQN